MPTSYEEALGCNNSLARIKSLYLESYLEGKVFSAQLATLRTEESEEGFQARTPQCESEDREEFSFRLASLGEEEFGEAAKRAYHREDLGELDGYVMEAIPPEILKPSTPSIPSNVQGSEDLKSCIRLILTKYLDVFSKQVGKEPAKVSPLVIDVDKRRWEVVRNRQPARKLGSLRDAELERQCELLLKMGVIELSIFFFHTGQFN